MAVNRAHPALVWLALVLGAAAVVVYISTWRADAHWKPEYASVPQDIRDWYESRTLTAAAQERFHFKSCCNNADVVKTKFKVGGAGNDEWFWLDGSTWREVPADIIHYDQFSPTGEPVMFAVGGKPVCFFPPSGGI